MNDYSHVLPVKLSKIVCLRCKDARLHAGNIVFPTEEVQKRFAESRWDRGYAPCNFTEGTRAWSIYAPPPKECPHMFEHGVAAARMTQE